MSPSSFKSSLIITHISTAAAILNIDGVNLLTDPVFSPAGTEWDLGRVTLKNTEGPAVTMDRLPPIDAVLLSHEDHPDNLDELGRQLLDGRKVLTTLDGAKNLHPRPGVRGLRPWEKVVLEAGNKRFEVTATPCKHLPGGECTGFILTTPEFGSTDDLPNAIYFTGDTVYFEELDLIRDKFKVLVAIMNLGGATANLPSGPLKITMDGEQAAQLFGAINAEILVPMHYESWEHFKEFGKDLAVQFEKAGIQDKVYWLTPGEPRKIL